MPVQAALVATQCSYVCSKVCADSLKKYTCSMQLLHLKPNNDGTVRAHHAECSANTLLILTLAIAAVPAVSAAAAADAAVLACRMVLLSRTLTPPCTSA